MELTPEQVVCIVGIEPLEGDTDDAVDATRAKIRKRTRDLYSDGNGLLESHRKARAEWLAGYIAQVRAEWLAGYIAQVRAEGAAAVVALLLEGLRSGGMSLSWLAEQLRERHGLPDGTLDALYHAGGQALTNALSGDIAAEEREACAALCRERAKRHERSAKSSVLAEGRRAANLAGVEAYECEAAIRARGENGEGHDH